MLELRKEQADRGANNWSTERIRSQRVINLLNVSHIYEITSFNILVKSIAGGAKSSSVGIITKKSLAMNWHHMGLLTSYQGLPGISSISKLCHLITRNHHFEIDFAFFSVHMEFFEESQCLRLNYLILYLWN
jgi:hypothetical protein